MKHRKIPLAVRIIIFPQVPHVCVGKLGQHWFWLSKPMLGYYSIGPIETNFSEILSKIQNFSFIKMHLKMSSAKLRPFCPGGGGGGWGWGGGGGGWGGGKGGGGWGGGGWGGGGGGWYVPCTYCHRVWLHEIYPIWTPHTFCLVYKFWVDSCAVYNAC